MEVTKITSSFDNKFGEGGYGAVFKGRLDDVMSIGRTSHVNIANLFGFCLDDLKRDLIYEYMPNGSLDKFIYSENLKAVLGWDKLYTIAIGIARGLEYLHHSCNTLIIHFDIKPQNILLDEDFHPKVANFGLAKLCHTKESKLSMTGARGTVGDGLQACEVSSEDEGIAKKMSVIGLRCIQILPMHRPTITKVLEMFERGLDELDMPPRQNFTYSLNVEITRTVSGTETRVLSEVLKMKEISIVNSKTLQRLPTL
uniref:Protein kinase domain-containing protein n=1 Tax=Setaria viridis TaxID=4556 RepID=A0A4U6UDQ8_SETVI|nr:hypothetical protein SEVIR_5G093200v2 [Setaria viridis]